MLRRLLLFSIFLACCACARAQDEARIVVRKFRVVGNTVLDAKTVRRTLDAYVGRPLTLKEIKAAARALRAQYRKRGYVMAYAYVPPQEFQDDVVEIRVQQGKLGKVKVEGNRHYSEELVRRFFAPAIEGHTYLYQPDLERALLVLNQQQDLRVQSVLEPKKDGKVDITLKVTDARPIHAILDYDNFGVRLVGKNRVGLGLVFGNVLSGGDLLALKTTYPFEVHGAQPFTFGTYSVPVGEDGSRIELSYAHARTFVGSELAALGLVGNAKIATLRYTFPDVLDLHSNTSWYGELNAKKVENTALAGLLPVSDDEVRTLTAGHRGSTLSRDGKAQTAHNYAIIGGLGSLLGGSRPGSMTSHVGADDYFVRATAELLASFTLPYDSSLVFHATLQGASKSLMVPEQFALGGPDSVRGFQQGEFLGDDGYALSLELRHVLSRGRFSEVQGLIFMDNGGAMVDKVAGSEKPQQELTSAGVGMRGQFGKNVSARADAGLCLAPTRNVDGDKAKLHVQVTGRF